MERMSVIKEPQSAWLSAIAALQTLDAWDWQALLDARARADSVGHILDPTGYRALIHDQTAEKNRQLAAAIVAFIASAKRTHPDIFADAPEPHSPKAATETGGEHG